MIKDKDKIFIIGGVDTDYKDMFSVIKLQNIAHYPPKPLERYFQGTLNTFLRNNNVPKSLENYYII